MNLPDLTNYLRTPDPEKPFATLFLSPEEQAELRPLEHQHKNLSFYWTGGYRGAAYKRLIITPSGTEDEPQPGQWIGALEMASEEPLPFFNRDLMERETGRGMLGDILRSGPFYQALCAKERQEQIAEAFNQAAGNKRTYSIPLGELLFTGTSQKISASESSLRLDAVASAGFRLSRSQMTVRIKRGEVRLNGRETRVPHRELKAGDFVSLSYKGRLRIASLQTTQKNRYRIDIEHYR